MGETGSGKTTFAKLLTRLMDPVRGRVLLASTPGWCRWTGRFASLRARVVMVPQDGFLFDGTLADNVRYGRPGMTDEEIELAFDRAGPGRLAGRPARRRATPRSASAASRCRRASASSSRWPAPTWPTPTCWCSTRPPARWTRPPRCGWPARSKRLTGGRTALSIAHRLSTAEGADEVLVFDAGRVVQRGPHAELVDAGGLRRLHASWRRSASGGPAPAA